MRIFFFLFFAFFFEFSFLFFFHDPFFTLVHDFFKGTAQDFRRFPPQKPQRAAAQGNNAVGDDRHGIPRGAEPLKIKEKAL